MSGEIVSPKAFSIGTARLEGAVVALIREWATAHPSELLALERMVKNLRFVGGGQPSDHMMHMAEIPVSLHVQLQRLLGHEYHHHYETRRLVLRNFTVGCVNRSAPGVTA